MLQWQQVNGEEELLPACSTSSRESNYHDSQGEINSFSQIRNALPTGLKKRLPSPCGSRHFMFRLSPSSLPLLRSTLLALFRSFLPAIFLLFPLSACFPQGITLGLSRFSVCSGPSAITLLLSLMPLSLDFSQSNFSGFTSDFNR